MISAKMNYKRLQLRTGSKLLEVIFIAGVNPQEFAQIMRGYEVELLSVPILCDEAMRLTAQPNNVKGKQTLKFVEQCYLLSGIVLVFQTQVTFLFDQVMRQAQYTYEFVQTSRSFNVRKKPIASSTPKKNRLQKKSQRNVETNFDWHSLDHDIEVDDEHTMQMLRTSKVMNRDQISIHEVIHESQMDLNDQSITFDEFDAAENGNTQNFLEMRELVAQGRSIIDIIRSDCFTPIVTDSDHNDQCDEEAPEEEYHALITRRQWSPAPDIDGSLEESDQDHLEPIQNTSTSVRRRRKRRVFDKVLQVPIKANHLKTDEKLMRCTDARSDCVKKIDILRNLKFKIFEEPSRALKTLEPRYMKDTASMMVGIQRVKRSRRKEADDLTMVDDFLNPIDRQPEQNDDTHGTDVDRPQPCNQIIPKRALPRETDFEVQDEPMYESDEAEPMFESELIVEPEPIIEPAFEPEPIFLSHPEPDHEPILPSVNHSRMIEPQQKSVIVSNKPKNCPYLANEDVPRNVQRMLNPFVTINKERPSEYGSQAFLVKKCQQNRQNWGLRGVLENLFRLWYNGIHPIGMKELMHPHKEKLAAALAFYSLLELNSPRIGLILIEKSENSNAVFNIAISPKLINVLQKNVK